MSAAGRGGVIPRVCETEGLRVKQEPHHIWRAWEAILKLDLISLVMGRSAFQRHPSYLMLRMEGPVPGDLRKLFWGQARESGGWLRACILEMLEGRIYESW